MNWSYFSSGAIAQRVFASIVSLMLASVMVVAFRTAMADAAVQSVVSGADMTDASARVRLLHARQWRPDLSDAWRLGADREAMVDPQAALQLARQAVRLNPDDWSNWHTLGLLEFQLDQTSAAQQAWSRAAALNTGYAAHSAAANLAFLLGNADEYWTEMRLALEDASANDILPALLNMQRLSGGQPEKIRAILPPGRADVAWAAIAFFVSHDHLRAATETWEQMPCPGYAAANCRDAALDLSRGWLETALRAQNAALSPSAHDSASATRLPPAQAVAHAQTIWNQGIQRGALRQGLAHTGTVTDGNFQFPWQGGFSWQPLAARPRLVPLAATSGANSLLWSPDGDQPDHVEIAWQWVAVEPQTAYQLTFGSRTAPAAAISGVHAIVSIPDRGLLFSLAAAASDNWTESSGVVRIPSGVSLIRLGLDYDRPLGQSSFRGQLSLRHVRLEPDAATPPNPQ